MRDDQLKDPVGAARSLLSVMGAAPRGMPIVLSAASGTGKTTLGQKLLHTMPELTLSISHTTRAARGREVDGESYHFVSTDTFEEMVRGKAFIEWAEVHGNLYGTAISEVQARMDEGRDVLLDIDIQGGRAIRDRFDSSLLIFLLPPSLSELEKRLRDRGTESEEQIHRRLLNARREIESAYFYDYLVVNDDVTHAAQTLQHIIQTERLRRMDKQALIANILST